MKPLNDRALANGSLVVLLAIGLVLLALLILAPGYAQAGLDGMQPVSLQSGLQANYSADPLGLAIQPIELKAVEQSIADHTSSTLSSRQQAAAMIEAMSTPVVIVTSMYSKTSPAVVSPTSPTPTLLNTATRQVLSPATATQTSLPVKATATKVLASTSTAKPLIPTKAAISPTPNRNIVTLQPTKTPTQPPVMIPATQTALPSKTQTWTPKPPANTETASLKPPTRTFTPKPATRTNTPPAYPPPATKITVKTPTLRAYP